METLAHEHEQNMKIKSQIDKISINGEENNGKNNEEFDTLIDLNAIAQKAKEEKIKREERRKRA